MNVMLLYLHVVTFRLYRETRSNSYRYARLPYRTCDFIRQQATPLSLR